MRKIIIAASLLTFSALSADAATNPQRMSGGGIYPVYVNVTGTNQTQASGIYVNQTQVQTVTTSFHGLSATGAGK